MTSNYVSSERVEQLVKKYTRARGRYGAGIGSFPRSSDVFRVCDIRKRIDIEGRSKRFNPDNHQVHCYCRFNDCAINSPPKSGVGPLRRKISRTLDYSPRATPPRYSRQRSCRHNVATPVLGVRWARDTINRADLGNGSAANDDSFSVSNDVKTPSSDRLSSGTYSLNVDTLGLTDLDPLTPQPFTRNYQSASLFRCSCVRGFSCSCQAPDVATPVSHKSREASVATNGFQEPVTGSLPVANDVISAKTGSRVLPQKLSKHEGWGFTDTASPFYFDDNLLDSQRRTGSHLTLVGDQSRKFENSVDSGHHTYQGTISPNSASNQMNVFCKIRVTEPEADCDDETFLKVIAGSTSTLGISSKVGINDTASESDSMSTDLKRKRKHTMGGKQSLKALKEAGVTHEGLSLTPDQRESDAPHADDIHSTSHVTHIVNSSGSGNIPDTIQNSKCPEKDTDFRPHIHRDDIAADSGGLELSYFRPETVSLFSKAEDSVFNR